MSTCQIANELFSQEKIPFLTRLPSSSRLQRAHGRDVAGAVGVGGVAEEGLEGHVLVVVVGRRKTLVVVGRARTFGRADRVSPGGEAVAANGRRKEINPLQLDPNF